LLINTLIRRACPPQAKNDELMEWVIIGSPGHIVLQNIMIHAKNQCK
jgi:mannosyltransferase OCH1-like enzyme